MNLNINNPNFNKGQLDAFNKQDYQNVDDNINYAYGYVIVSAKSDLSNGIINHNLLSLLPQEVREHYNRIISRSPIEMYE